MVPDTTQPINRFSVSAFDATATEAIKILRETNTIDFDTANSLTSAIPKLKRIIYRSFYDQWQALVPYSLNNLPNDEVISRINDPLTYIEIESRSPIHRLGR